jgi:Ferritin-like domain
VSVNEPMHISEAELRGMTADLDAMHHDLTLPALHDSLAEWAADIHERSNGDQAEQTAAQALLGRRRFLTRAGVVAGGAAGAAILAACSSSSSSSSAPASAGAGSAAAAASGGEGQSLSGDLRVVGMAASLENSGVATYQAGIAAATAGKLGTVPPAVANFAETAMAQHEDHQKAWNAVLTSAGKKPVTAVDPVIQPTITTAFGKITNVTGLAKLALMVENIAGETYQNGLSVITSAAGIKTAASIQPVEFQHAAILYFILGKYPVPSAFTAVTNARTATDYRP